MKILAALILSACLSTSLMGAPTPAPTPEVDRSFALGMGDTLPDELQEPVTKALEKRFPNEQPLAIVIHMIECKSGLCEESLKNIQQFVYADLEGSKLVILAIAVGSDEAEAQALAKRAEIKFPIIADKDRKLYAKFATDGVPRTVIADRDGKVVYTNSGYIAGREAEYRAVVDSLLNESALPKGVGDTSGTMADDDLMARDVRGQQAPDVPVEMWINPLPANTEGKYKLVDFWATWCGPCRNALEYSETIHGQFEDKLVTMAISDEPAAVVQEYVKSAKLKQPVGIDTKGRANSFLEIKGIPHAILINPAGKVVFQGHPMTLWADNGKLMREALAGKEFIPAKKTKK